MKAKYFLLIVLSISIVLIAGFVYYTKGTDEMFKNVLVITFWITVLAVQIIILGWLFYKMSQLFKSKK
jgi:Tfp pilus assembly protein PilO